MRSTFGVLAMVSGALVGFLATQVKASTGPIPLNCDRACLEGVMDQYLAAVVAHDPKRLPLSEDVMYTENNQVHRGGRRLLEDRRRPRQLQALLRRSGIRPGRRSWARCRKPAPRC